MKKRLLALFLAATMVVGFAACGGKENSKSNKGGSSSAETTLVVGYSPFSSKFSPFFANTTYDQDAQAMTQLSLFKTDRLGQVIYKGIEGETHEYNGTDYTYYGPADIEVTENEDGTVYYDITLRDDITFSDGEKLTIDDLMFTYYVKCDPTYDGSATLYSQPIEGMEEYRSGMSTLATLLAEAGEENTDFSLWTEEQQTAFWDAVNGGLSDFAQEIVDYCAEKGLVADASDVAGAAAAWGFDLPAGATTKDFGLAIGDNYGWNFSSMEAETAGSALSDLIPEDVYAYGTMGIATGDSADFISGFQKTGDYSMRVVSTEVSATLIYQLGTEIAPLHYYGDASKFDADAHQFGFEKGDLSGVRSKTTEPLGAGAYVFQKYENGVINYVANENYFLGEPKIKYINFREVEENDKLNGVINGEIDITDPTFSKDTATAISSANGGDISGDVITTDTVDMLGYGYIGMNAERIKVGNDKGSEESKNLRKALATIISVYRDVAIDSYYADAASVINYPISNTSWAAPQPTDEGYQVAFSTDVDGNPIYTSEMSTDDKYAAAKEAALGFFEAAGYTVSDGKVTAAPAGGKMEYEVLIPGGGSGDHPAFMILTLAKEAFEEIGISLIVTDLTQTNDLWDGLDAGTVDMWAAAWGATIDPDMYQIYYSDVANGGKNAGGDNSKYNIADEELDQLIVDARHSTDQEYRRTIYKAALDIVIDWACEIPTYQRQNAIIFSTERVNMDTVTPDITTFYGWMSEIENMEMK